MLGSYFPVFLSKFLLSSFYLLPEVLDIRCCNTRIQKTYSFFFFFSGPTSKWIPFILHQYIYILSIREYFSFTRPRDEKYLISLTSIVVTQVLSNFWKGSIENCLKKKKRIKYLISSVSLDGFVYNYTGKFNLLTVTA